MKIRHAFLLMLACVWQVLAQETQGPAGSGLPERFQQLDRKGDGKLTPQELPGEWFGRLDGNADGEIALEEARSAAALGLRRGGDAAGPDPPMGVHKGLQYAQTEGIEPNLLSLDLYLPQGTRSAPVAIVVHGGSWQKGDKGQAEGTSLLHSFIREGYIVAALNYRLAPAAQFPAYPQDVAAGIAWVRQHAGEHGGDANRIVLIGHSAGAHLVALVATDEGYLQKHGMGLQDLRAVIPLDTEAYDLPHLAERFGGRLPDTWGVPFGQDPEIWKQASPTTHVAAGRGIPPMLIVHSGGMMEPQGKYNPSRAEDAQAFAEVLRQAGARAEVVGDPEKSHTQIIREFGLPNDTIASAVFAFLRSCLSAAPTPLPATTGFVADDVRMGAAEVSYIDPEILHTEGRMAFLDARLSVWVGELDPQTGLFRTASGCDQLVDKGISQWSRYSNGPEWGLDRDGPALFYVKDDAQGRGQLWRAAPPWDDPRLTQLTHDAKAHNWICEASLNPALPSARIAVYHGNPGAEGNVDAWLDESAADALHELVRPMVVARWATNTPYVTFAPKPRPGQAEPTQVTLVDTDTAASRVITADAGNKVDPWLWQAPEFGGDALLCVNVDHRAVSLYRDTKHDGSPWEHIATLALPADAPHRYLKSVEPLAGGRGAFGHSYFTVQAGDDRDAATSIWLFGYDPGGQHLVRRLDDGAVTGKEARRLDPESFVGEREVFVYYTLPGEGAAQLHRCRTGITKGER